MFQRLRTMTDRWVPAQYLADNEKLRKSRLVVDSCLLVMLMCFFYTVFYLVVGYYIGVGICLYGGLSALFAVNVFRRKGNFKFSGNFFAFTSLNVFVLFTITTYGLGTLIAAWLLIVPISAFLMAGIRSGIFWAGMTLVLVGVLFVFEINGIGLPAYFEREKIVYVNLVALLGLIFYLAMIFLNNEIGKENVMRKLLHASEEIELKNTEITAINRQLEDKVNQRTKHLKEAKDELDLFLYESSHALRRPLVRIMGLLSLVKSESDPEEQENMMQLVDFTVDKMDEMLRDLLVISEVLHREPSWVPTNLNALIENEIQKYASPEVKIQFSPSATVELLSEKGLLQILLEKLMENAVSYSTPDDQAHEVRIGLHVHNDSCVLTIEDRGTGIDPAALPELFRMFYKGTEKSQGSGLGLFIVQKILDRLGGSIEVESELGSFARFTVTLALEGDGVPVIL